MVSCARATRALRRASLDARSRRPSSLPSRENIEERACPMREEGRRPGVLLARATRPVRLSGWLVYLVCLVCLVCPVYLVYSVIVWFNPITR